MSSTRLPGKVLLPLAGKPMIHHIVDRAKLCTNVGKIVVATSVENSDNPLVEYCRENNIDYYRGSLNNVYLRFVKVIKKNKASSFIRITADSPFIDPSLIDYGIKLYNSGKYDMVTNTFQRSFPKGQSFSIHNSNKFVNNLKNIKSKNHKEHITPFFYVNSKKFKIKNIFYNSNQSLLNMSVDTKDDLKKARKIEKKLKIIKKKNYLSNLIKLYTK